VVHLDHLEAAAVERADTGETARNRWPPFHPTAGVLGPTKQTAVELESSGWLGSDAVVVLMRGIDEVVALPVDDRARHLQNR
jgi:hypothetical protein